ncbi:ribosomal protein L7/L12 [Kitasatospora sp. NPDC001547]|uniref:ribosomal protein L7/L12 n=1 Tax=Kitasatospora sp. NPDC001547 TaxID=3364015 RepID=UPI00367E5353
MEDPQFTALVTGAGNEGPDALRAVRAVTGLSLWRSKVLLGSAPAVVLEEVPFDTAVGAARRLREAGVPAVVRCTWCDRTVPGDEAPLDPGPCASRSWPSAHCLANSLTSCGCESCAAYGPIRLTL